MATVADAPNDNAHRDSMDRGSAQQDRTNWALLLDRLSREHEGERVTIELLDPSYGDQDQAQRLPFTYASFDSRDNVVVVAVGGTTPSFPVVLRHIIWKPTEVHAADTAFRVLDADGTATVVTFFPGQPTS
jgi:hypothetical protein